MQWSRDIRWSRDGGTDIRCVVTRRGGTCTLSVRGKGRGKLYDAGTMGIRGSNELLTNAAVISRKLAS